MRVSKEHINNFKKALKLKSERTQSTYMIMVDKFLREVNLDISRDKVVDFFLKLSKNSRPTYYYAIKFFFTSNNLPFDIKRREVVSGGIKQEKPVLRREEIKKIIDYLVTDYHGFILDRDIEVGYFALVTVYGLRRIELWDLTHKDINTKDWTITVRTAKSKDYIDERIHIVPDEIKPIVENMKASLKKLKNKPVISTMNEIFLNVCMECDIELRPRLGWHSVRRALVTELLMKNINPTIVRSFLRWKPRETDIILNYDIKDPVAVDTVVFEHHPFLGFWKRSMDDNKVEVVGVEAVKTVVSEEEFEKILKKSIQEFIKEKKDRRNIIRG